MTHRMKLQLKQHRHDHTLYIEYFSTQNVHRLALRYIASYNPNVNNFIDIVNMVCTIMIREPSLTPNWKA
jgi:hypothetical protein